MAAGKRYLEEMTLPHDVDRQHVNEMLDIAEKLGPDGLSKDMASMSVLLIYFHVCKFAMVCSRKRSRRSCCSGGWQGNI